MHWMELPIKENLYAATMLTMAADSARVAAQEAATVREAALAEALAVVHVVAHVAAVTETAVDREMEAVLMVAANPAVAMITTEEAAGLPNRIEAAEILNVPAMKVEKIIGNSFSSMTTAT